MKNNTIRNILLIALAFLGIGAIGGGSVLIISPSGDLLGIPISEFKNIPFDSFLIPGIFLFTVLGVVPLLLIIALVKKPNFRLFEWFNIFKDMHWVWTFTIYIAFILIAWIHIQLVFLQNGVHWLHTFYMVYAMVIIILALFPAVKRFYKNEIIKNQES